MDKVPREIKEAMDQNNLKDALQETDMPTKFKAMVLGLSTFNVLRGEDQNHKKK